MKKALAIVAVLVVLAILAAVVLRSTASPFLPLPTPNGYDELLAAGEAVIIVPPDIAQLPFELLRSAVRQNSNAIAMTHAALKHPSVVRLDMQMPRQPNTTNLGNLRALALLLVADGKVTEADGHTNEAAGIFTDAIDLGAATSHGGLLIDYLTANAIQALGREQIERVAPSLDGATCTNLAMRISAADAKAEPIKTVLDRDAAWRRAGIDYIRLTILKYSTRDSLGRIERNLAMRCAKSHAELRVLETELALRACLLDRRQPPDTLGRLVPAYLPAVPGDPFSGQPLVYAHSTNGLLVYSVGPDRKDDGGTPIKRVGTNELGDIVRRIP